jgi:hypothetical protein
VTAGLTLLLAWRRRAVSLVHQAAAVGVLAALFLATLVPEPVTVSSLACRLALAAYCLIGAVVYASPGFASGFLLIVNYEVWRMLWESPAARSMIAPEIVVLGAVGASCFGLWWVFRSRVPRAVAHVGAVLMVVSVGLAHFSGSSALPWSALLLAAAGVASLLAAAGRAYGWWSYYGLSGGTLLMPLGRAVHRSGPASGSPGGWLLVLAAFAALGLGFLVSTHKSPAGQRQAT